METPRLTGQTRYRPHVHEGEVLLVLQVQYTYNAPISGWRDAKIEDLRGNQVEARR